MISSTISFLHELPHELPNNLKRRTLGNQENLKIGLRENLEYILPSRNKILVIAAKNYVRQDLKVFCSRPILLDFFTLYHLFSNVNDCSVRNIISIKTGYMHCMKGLTLQAPTPQNGQTHSNNSLAFANELFEYV